MIRLRCSVSGGLEDLAQDEILRLLVPCCCPKQQQQTTTTTNNKSNKNNYIQWIHRGHSGSQLEFTIPSRELLPPQKILTRLRFVEYVYWIVHSSEVIMMDNTQKSMETENSENDNNPSENESQFLLASIQSNVSNHLNVKAFIESLHYWQHEIAPIFPNVEKLPGTLWPTIVSSSHDTTTTTTTTASHHHPTSTNDKTNSSLLPNYIGNNNINTIYTQPHIAKSIVHVFLQMIQTYYCCKYTDHNVLYIDAGAGSGALLQHLPVNQRIGIDLQQQQQPQQHNDHSEIHQGDFLTIDREWLFHHHHQHQQKQMHPTTNTSTFVVAVISNPPFAEGSRGDYSPIVQFINHSFETLQAMCMGVIVPTNFARVRIWKSLGLSPNIQLVARCLLPQDSFYDPASSTTTMRQQQCKNINSIFLFFGRKQQQQQQQLKQDDNNQEEEEVTIQNRIIEITSNRDKGKFPFLRTADMSAAIMAGLPSNLDQHVSQTAATVSLHAELKKLQSPTRTLLELSILLNPKQPLSLINCTSQSIPNHSLGFMSTSVKPPVAYAICQSAIQSASPMIPSNATNKRNNNQTTTTITTNDDDNDDNDNDNNNCTPLVVVNAMCGEGTFELESQNETLSLSQSFFWIGGDKNEHAVRDTAKRLNSLQQQQQQQKEKKGSSTRRPLVDLVIWDAQNLPLRDEIANVYIADLPIAGSQKQKHQEPRVSDPATSSSSSSSSLHYKRVLAHAVRVLQSNLNGRAALISTDTKTLAHTTGMFNGKWSILWRNRLNLGGLTGKLLFLQKLAPSTKDLSVWVQSSTKVIHNENHESLLQSELIQRLQDIATKAVANFWLDEVLELHRSDTNEMPPSCSTRRTGETYATSNKNDCLVTRVELIDTYFHQEKHCWSHCYRFWFDHRISGMQAKVLEQEIRGALKAHMPSQILGLR